jgi:competence protein ComGF
LGFLSSAQPTNIIRKTLKYEQYKNKKIKTDGNSKAEIEIVNLSTNNSIYSQKMLILFYVISVI